VSIAHTPKVHVYRGAADWTGAQHGGTTSYEAYSRDYTFTIPGKPTVVGSADVPFRGDPARLNPEDLLLCALSTCHLLSYLALCARGGIVVTSYHDDATGTMTFVDGKLRFTDVLLRPRVTLALGDPDKARALHDRAHAECYIASSVNFPVRHEPTVEPHH
jgi:organic hydroperoxide reductase OsmC/OhrA